MGHAIPSKPAGARSAAIYRSLPLRAQALGAVAASMLLTALLYAGRQAGEPAPPSLNAARFSVAMLAGPKQAAQEAPRNADQVAISVAPSVEPANQVVTAERPTSLPQAVAAAQDASVGPEAAQADEVIPPARVSMPGGRLMAMDVSLGEQPDPFATGPRQVYLRLFVDESGKVVRGGIARPGTEPLRDALILKAMTSRAYATSNLKIRGADGLWQLDLVIDYGTNEFLP